MLVHVQVYGFKNGSAIILATKRSVGLAPEVNLITHNMQVTQMRESTLALKLRANVTRSPVQMYQWPHKNDCFRENGAILTEKAIVFSQKKTI